MRLESPKTSAAACCVKLWWCSCETWPLACLLHGTRAQIVSGQFQILIIAKVHTVAPLTQPGTVEQRRGF